MQELTAKRAREVFDYDPETGKIIRKEKVSGSVPVGSEMGFVGSHGYLAVMIDNKDYLVHRLIFLWVYGRWPKGQIDHKNHIKTDNKIKNLREATHRENGINQKLSKNNTSGSNGVYWNKGVNKWQSYINVHGKAIYLGVFIDINDAISARKEADIKHGFHKNHGLEVARI